MDNINQSKRNSNKREDEGHMVGPANKKARHLIQKLDKNDLGMS